MTPAESRALSRAAIVLLLASAARLGVEAGRDEPIFATDSADVLTDLTGATVAAREDQERRARPLESSERLDPNRASAVDLDRLPGVGPATADEIVRDRETLGAFRSVDDLVRVRGVGPVTLERIRPHVRITTVPVSLSGQAARRSETLAGGERVDLNRADSAKLLALPGVGPSLARRIIEYRSRNGPFRRVEDLLNVRGIGPATLAKLEAKATIKR